MRAADANAFRNSRHRSRSCPATTGGNRSSPRHSSHGRPEMSMHTSARASSMGTRANPTRAMPARSPRASARAWPRHRPTSSTVWWASMCRSPVQDRVRSNPAQNAARVMTWSAMPNPVCTLTRPCPSTTRSRRMEVSLVSRNTAALRWLISGSFRGAWFMCVDRCVPRRGASRPARPCRGRAFRRRRPLPARPLRPLRPLRAFSCRTRRPRGCLFHTAQAWAPPSSTARKHPAG